MPPAAHYHKALIETCTNLGTKKWSVVRQWGKGWPMARGDGQGGCACASRRMRGGRAGAHLGPGYSSIQGLDGDGQ